MTPLATPLRKSVGKLLVCLVVAFILTACGGGGGGDTTANPSTAKVYVVTSSGASISDAATNIQVEVPAGAMASTFKLTISKSESNNTFVQLVNGSTFLAGGSQFTIEGDFPGSLSKSARVTIPYDKNLVVDSNSLGVAYYSYTTNRFVPVEILSIDSINGTITFETNHFSIWVPIFGLISISGAYKSAITEFNPVRDGFPFENNLSAPYGVVVNGFGKTIIGNCLGMSGLALSYFHYRKSDKSGAGLNQLLSGYSRNCSSSFSNEILCSGINKASTALNSTWSVFNNALAGRRVLDVSDGESARSIYLALTQYGNVPITVGILDANRDNGHAVVVYKYIANSDGSGTFYYYDPNLPNTENLFSHSADGKITAFYYGGGTVHLSKYVFASPFLGGGMTPTQATEILSNYFPAQVVTSSIRLYSLSGYVAQPSITGNFATDAFNQLNYSRAKVGLNILNRAAELDQAAVSHSKYFSVNGVSGSGAGGFHTEISGRPNFTGVTAANRAAAAGYSNSSTVGENMTIGTNLGQNATVGLIAVPYHRFTELSAYSDAGAGYFGTTYTIDFGGRASNWGPSVNELLAYPAPGQTDVPVGTSSAEYPNPLPDIPARQIGYPISLLGAFGETLTINSMTLSDPQGNSIPGRLVTTNTETGAALGNYGFFIPLPPWTSPPTPTTAGILNQNTTYTATASGVYRGLPFNLSWSFTTATYQ